MVIIISFVFSNTNTTNQCDKLTILNPKQGIQTNDLPIERWFCWLDNLSHSTQTDQGMEDLTSWDQCMEDLTSWDQCMEDLTSWDQQELLAQ